MIFTDLFFCIIKSLTSLLFLHSLGTHKSKSLLPFVTGTAVLSAVSFGSSFLPYWAFTIICVTTLSLAGRILFEDNFHRIFALSITCTYTFSITEIIGKSLFIWGMGGDFKIVFFTSILNHIIICAVVTAMGIGVLYAIYKLLSEEKTDAIKEVWLHFSFVISVFQFVAAVFVSFYTLDGTQTDNALLIVIVSIAFLLMSLMVINFFTEICNAYKREKQIYTLRSDYSAVKEQLAVQFQTSKRLKKIRHDIKNHLMNAAMLIDSGETDKARELLYEISESADKLQPVLSETTGNSLIDAVVAYKAAVCESKDIKFSYSLELLPEIKTPLSDISSVLSNLLDNATEAAEKAETATINVRIFSYKNYITIIVKNTFSQVYRHDTGKLFSKKNDSDSHGLGMEIIGEICEKNGGVYKYKTSGMWFTASVLMKM